MATIRLGQTTSVARRRKAAAAGGRFEAMKSTVLAGIAARLPACLALAALLLAAALLAAGPAEAQQAHRRSLLDIIFGAPRHAEYPPAPPPPGRPTRHAPARRHTAPRSAPAVAAPAGVDKRDDAKKLLVVGDFIAAGLADGLQEAFAEAPGVVVIDKTSGSSGLVRNDYYDWPARIGAILDDVKPSVAVVLVGSNDRQAMRIDGKAEPVRSDRWTAEYTSRATALADAIARRHIPLLWVGVPAFQSPSMSADILAFDGIFRAVAAKAGGEFIDTWDGFVDQDGNFIFTGPDINGQPARLRGPDGINLTAAGKRKLAFYVEKPARRLLGSAAEKDVAAPIGEGEAGPTGLPPQPPERITRTDPIGLTDPALDGDTALLGGHPGKAPDTAGDTPRALLVRDGKAPKPQSGRADQFARDGGTADAPAKGADAASPHPPVFAAPVGTGSAGP